MKLCKLKLKNLNSFRKAIELDFEESPLGDASLVAITGPTGAGKTTLLDAICVALYGKTPRLSGNKNQHPRHLISHGEEEGFAEVRFEANDKRFHATWSIKRKGSPKWQLFDNSGKLITTKVAQEVESILGLDFGAFRRSVMLAQGEFAAFLKANSEDRRKILEATAGISIYDVLKDKLNEKVAEVEAVNADVLAKIAKIPEASREQLADAETELDRLQTEANVFQMDSQQVEKDKQREVERKGDFERLQVSEDRQDELLSEQQEIDTLQVEREDAERAKDLRSEKRECDAAKSDFENAENALNTATTEKTEAEKQVETDQADFDGKEVVYQTASTEHKQKISIYNDAKLAVGRAGVQFAEAGNRTPKLADLNEEIDTLSDELTDKEVEQVRLQKQITEAQTFLDENPLPTDRQHRLNRANILFAQLDSQQKQLETALTNEAEHCEKVASLKREIEKLSKTHAERLSKKTEAEDTLETVTAELNNLLATGTREEWTDRKQQVVRAQPIVQRYEDMEEDVEDMSRRSSELGNTVSTLNVQLGQIEEELRKQTEVCRFAAEAVERCEDTLRSVMLSTPINQLRQRLQPGEPCLVCGATHHPRTHVVEPEGGELQQEAENALENAKVNERNAQDLVQDLRTQRGQLQQNKRNIVSRIGEFRAEIEAFQGEKESLDRQWEEIRPVLETSFDQIVEQDVINISSDWIVEQIEKADTAIVALAEAEQARTAASHAYELVSQQLENCQNDMRREEGSLNEVEKQLASASNAVADLQANLASTEERFWVFLPEDFHGVAPDVAIDRFRNKIKTVETQETALDSTQNQLNLLNTKIEADQQNLETLKANRENLQGEINEYRSQGKVLLDAVREKTGGLETQDEIDAAIDALVADLQVKETERDAAEKRLQNAQNLLTEKRTAHGISEKHHKGCDEKFERARRTYFERLSDAGFDSPEAHNDAFRDDVQLQELTNRLDAYEDEKQRLVLDITRLRTRFEETPYDPEALARIETEAEEIGRQLEAAQQAVGAQQERIDNLKDWLKKREALGNEVKKAEAELIRWKNLQDTIPANSLRDFALEIMFKQMGTLANVQLDYLTSERYQLKVESIGDLSVIDRWNANEERPVETLSGGESFLTSLALALALADLSRGRAELHSLFLDEGFGTLDAETLDTAIAALEGLRMQGRSIFLISHVQELTRRIPVKINVRKRGDGSSSVQV